MLVRRLLIAVLVLCAWAGLGLVRSAEANPILTVTVTGTIVTGTDDGSFTGGVGALDGFSVTMVQTYVVTPTYSEVGSDPLSGVFDSVGLSITVSGFGTLAFTDPAGPGLVTVGTLGNTLDGAAQFFGFQLLSTGGGSVTSNVAISSLTEALIAAAVVLADQDFDLQLPLTGVDSSFGAALLDANSNTLAEFFVAGASSFVVTLSGQPEPIPEPVSLAVFALGLGGLVAARRRRFRCA
jgi:hypothetical protein